MYRFGSSCLDETLFRHSSVLLHSCAVPEGGGWAVMNNDPWMDFKSCASCSDVKAKSGGLEPEVMVHVDYVPRSRRSGGM